MFQGIAGEIWKLTVMASPYLLLGFLLAGIIRAVFNEEAIRKRVGQRNFKSIVLASLFGIPLPLCSCGVMPAAASLRKSGASRGATASFLISTPESGVDSIAISYALLDPILTVVRPVVAFVTAITAGTFTNMVDRGEGEDNPGTVSCCCSAANHETDRQRFITKIRNGIHYSFFDLLPSISLYMIEGLVLAGIISYLIPASWIQEYMGSGITAMLIMLVAGIPLYICATSSTPIAAALILKGMSPGTALVFLLAGPATNFATMILVHKILGRKYLFIYLACIAICALLFGLGVDVLYNRLGVEATASVKQSVHEFPYLLTFLTGILLTALLLYGIWVENLRAKVKKLLSTSGRKAFP